MPKKTAIVLFNLGGPNTLEVVPSFLFNLFSDKAIISLPQPLRYMVAKLISNKRAPKTQAIYEKLGGRSPIVPLTKQQADALERMLGGEEAGYKVFFSMRYWHPFSEEVAAGVKRYHPDEIILLPLYPQFSVTTTASSVKDWEITAKKCGIDVPTKSICCYPEQHDFIQSHVNLILDHYQHIAHKKPRLLFSAHGLPQKVIDKGDPYQWQVERTVTAIVEKLAIDELDYRICYQSRVGPLKWIGPSSEEEILLAGKQGVPVLVIPVAFVSEHSETLYELDIQYKELAEQVGVPDYIRVPALSIEGHYIRALATLCKEVADKPAGICPPSGKRLCPHEWDGCPVRVR